MSRPTLWLFAGQGSQFPGLGKEFDDNFRLYRDTFAEASDCLHRDLRKLALHGSTEDLTDTQNTQPVLFTYGQAVAKILTEEAGGQALAAGGHSLGEITAAVFFGALSFAEGLKAVQQRATLMAEAVRDRPVAMAAILGLESDKLETICASVRQQSDLTVVCANYNAPDQTVISGDAEAVDLAGSKARARGARRVISLAVSAPFHSPLMLDAATHFDDSLHTLTFDSPSIPTWSNVTAQPYDSVSGIRNLWVQQVHKPVRFVEQIRNMVRSFVNAQILEISPRSTLAPLIRKIAPDTMATTVSTLEQFKAWAA